MYFYKIEDIERVIPSTYNDKYINKGKGKDILEKAENEKSFWVSGKEITKFFWSKKGKTVNRN